MLTIFLLCAIPAQKTAQRAIDYEWEVNAPTASRLVTAGVGTGTPLIT